MQGHIGVNPVIDAGLERPKQPRSLPRYIERDSEVTKALAEAATPATGGRGVWPERDLALAALLAGTGMRASELCGLRIRDLVLDVEDPYVRVRGKAAPCARVPFRPR
jgi:site-specific recombinase XerC